MRIGFSKTVLVVCCGLGLASCANQKLNSGRNVQFDGMTFRAKLSKGDDRAEFSIAVHEPSKSLSGAREAGRYEATKYCIKNYGTSDVIWTHGPDDAENSLIVVDGSLQFSGRCKGW